MTTQSLTIILSLIFASIFVYQLRRIIVARRSVQPKIKALRSQIIELQLALCDVSEVVSSMERTLQREYQAKGAEMIQKVTRARAIITALHRRIEQASALLNERNAANILAAEELLTRSLSTRLDCFVSLIDDNSDCDITSDKWLAELRRIKRELSIVALPKVA